MPLKYGKQTAFHLNALDKEIMSRCYNDPRNALKTWMMGYFDGMVLPYQSYFYAAPQRTKTLIAGIRTGKSELASMGFMHFAQFNPGSLLLNTSISSEQAKIVYTKCLRLCEMPRFRHWVQHIASSPYPEITLVNGSKLWFRSLGYESELIRGFEFDLISVDEAGYVAREQAITTLRGRLLGINPQTKKPRAGIMWFISSPKGRGWLYEQWKLGDPTFPNARLDTNLSLRATTFDNPLLDQKLLQETLESLSHNMRLQELYGIFLEDNDVLFPLTLVNEACDPDDREVRWLYDQIRFWNVRHSDEKKILYANTRLALPEGHLERISEDIDHYECEPVPGHRYVNSWDMGKKATAKGRNATVGMVFDITHEPWKLVAYWYDETMGYLDAKTNMENWHQKYSSNGAMCTTAFDATGKGDIIKDYIEREKTIDDVEGYVYSGQNKPYLLQAGKLAIERGLVRMPFIKKVVDQLSQYTVEDEKIAQDIVMAFCQAMHKAREMTRISQSASPNRHRQPMSTDPGADSQHPRSIQSRRSGRFMQARLGSRTLRKNLYGATRGGRSRAG